MSPGDSGTSGRRAGRVARVAGGLDRRSDGGLDGHGDGGLLGLGGRDDLGELGSNVGALGLGDTVGLGGNDVGDGGSDRPAVIDHVVVSEKALRQSRISHSLGKRDDDSLDGDLVAESGALDLGQRGVLQVELLEEVVPDRVEESLVLVAGGGGDVGGLGNVLGGHGRGSTDVLGDGRGGVLGLGDVNSGRRMNRDGRSDGLVL